MPHLRSSFYCGCCPVEVSASSTIRSIYHSTHITIAGTNCNIYHMYDLSTFGTNCSVCYAANIGGICYTADFRAFNRLSNISIRVILVALQSESNAKQPRTLVTTSNGVPQATSSSPQTSASVPRVVSLTSTRISTSSSESVYVILKRS